MGQLLPLLLSRHKWCFWKHGEHFLGVDIYWVVQMFLKWKSNSSNYRQTDRVQSPVFFETSANYRGRKADVSLPCLHSRSEN